MLNQSRCAISFISELELLSFPTNSAIVQAYTESLLNSLNIVSYSDTIKTETINIRKSTKLKLPDALILATAMSETCPLLTADIAFSQNTYYPYVLIYQPFP
jgi:predicted nucleic acid-binding protein